jgi:hypothetical protein
VRSTILQEHVRKGLGKKLRLTLDVKTRWNFLITMIEWLLQLKPFIQQAVMDTGNDDIYKEADFEILTDILKVLKPTELTEPEGTQQREFNALNLWDVFKFLFKTL